MTAILVIAGIVGIIWSAVALRFGGLLAGCLGVLLAGSCFGHPFFHASLGPLPVTSDRLLLAGLCVLLVVGYRTRLVDAKPLGRADWLLGLLLAALAASTFSHDWRIDDAQPAATLLFCYGTPAALYWLGRQSRLEPHRLQMLFGFFALFGLYLAVTAVAEVLQLSWLVFPKYIVSAEHQEFLGRGRGPLLNPVGNGMYLTAGVAAALLWWPRWDRLGKLVLLVFAAVLLVGAFCTLTRSVWLGAFLSVGVVVALGIPRQWRVPLLTCAALGVALVLVVKGQGLAAFKRDKHVSAFEMGQSAKLRPVLIEVAWRMFRDRPLAGHGFGQYKQADRLYWRDPSSKLPLEKAKPYVQHNVLLALLSETGLVGCGLFCALLAVWTRQAWRVWRDAQSPLAERQLGLLLLALLAAHLANGMFHDVSIIPMVNMLLFFVAGVCQGLAVGKQAARPAAAGPPAQRFPAPALVR